MEALYRNGVKTSMPAVRKFLQQQQAAAAVPVMVQYRAVPGVPGEPCSLLLSALSPLSERREETAAACSPRTRATTHQHQTQS